jgi:hypothetical protein
MMISSARWMDFRIGSCAALSEPEGAEGIGPPHLRTAWVYLGKLYGGRAVSVVRSWALRRHLAMVLPWRIALLLF